MAIINGNKNANLINGTSGNDIINGLGGADRLFGLDGDDTLDGGDNEDRLDGGNGRDILIGGAGRDILLGGAGNDILNGGLADDEMDGGSGTDTIVYTGLESEYRVTIRAGSVNVTDRNIANGNDGTDTIVNAERIRFADHTIFLVPNNAPVAAGNNYSVNEDGVLNVNAAAGLLGNDSDADGDPLTAVLVGTGPAHGSLVLNPDGSFAYTPVADFNGADSFTYKPNDGFDDGNTVTVSITVNPVPDAPVALGNGFSLNEDGSVSFSLLGLLANDSDPDGDLFGFFDFVGAPAHGQLIDNGGGSYSYVPAANFNGQDSLGYRIQDSTGSISNAATILFTVNPVNDPPVGVDDTIYVTPNVNRRIYVLDLLSNDTDVDGSPVESITNVTQPVHGVLQLEFGYFLYTPPAGFLGTDSFTYQPDDGQGGSAATVTLIVDNRPVAVGDSDTTNEDTARIIAVLANDSDADASQTLTPIIVDHADHGSLFVQANGTIKYTPAADYNGPDSFTYKLNDGLLDSNVVTVSLTVTPVNDAPDAVDNAYSVNEDNVLNVAAAGVLANDTDLEGDALTAVLVAGPSHGTLTLNSNGSFSYTPAANYNGADSFTYRANDGALNSNIATVDITINPVEDAPVAVGESLTRANVNGVVTLSWADLLANDYDPDGTPVVITLAYATGVPPPGPDDPPTVETNAAGNAYIVHVPVDFTGTFSLHYEVFSGGQESNEVIASVTVPGDSAPASAASFVGPDSDVIVTPDLFF